MSARPEEVVPGLRACVCWVPRAVGKFQTIFMSRPSSDARTPGAHFLACASTHTQAGSLPQACRGAAHDGDETLEGVTSPAGEAGEAGLFAGQCTEHQAAACSLASSHVMARFRPDSCGNWGACRVQKAMSSAVSQPGKIALQAPRLGDAPVQPRLAPLGYRGCLLPTAGSF
jgi:hypothetical protein